MLEQYQHELQPGAIIGTYTVEACLGQGGMGKVYLASDHNQRKVAIKVLESTFMRASEQKIRFGNEIMSVFGFKHPNIVQAHEFISTKDFQAFVMEYVDGGNLKNFFGSSRPGFDVVTSILLQVANGLKAIHERGIVHRDVKPENILITHNGIAKISDFGVARSIGSNTITQEGCMVGTVLYVAPEYIETGECDYRADIYALGLIGYELATGYFPFRGTSKSSILRARFVDPPPLLNVCPKIPPYLALVIEKAINRKISQRFQTTSEFLEALMQVEKMYFEPSKKEAPNCPVKHSALGVFNGVIKKLKHFFLGFQQIDRRS